MVNFLKTGLLHADALATVSRTYAEEIQTAEFGMGLEDLLRQRREALTGIVNGVDYGDWDPETDTLIQHNYSAADLAGKAEVKRALLEEFQPRLRRAGSGPRHRLPPDRPEGLRAAAGHPAAAPASGYDLRLVVLGSGETELEAYFQRLRDSYPQKVATYRGYNNELAHRSKPGRIVFLMPSRYEPCGLNQMYSLKYGTAPIVRRTGGLADTVEHFDPTGSGTGFVFDAFDAQALLLRSSQALSVWRMPTAWAQMVQNGMAQDFSWDRQGREYEALYRSLVGAPERAPEAARAVALTPSSPGVQVPLPTNEGEKSCTSYSSNPRSPATSGSSCAPCTRSAPG